MARPLPVALLTVLALCHGAGAAPARTAADVLPATLSVEVATIRNGKPSQKSTWKVRPGERIVVRDENQVPYVRGVSTKGTDTASVRSGLVVSIVSTLTDGRLGFALTSSVSEVLAMESMAVAVGGRTVTVAAPSVRDRSFETTVEPMPGNGEWRTRQAIGDTGFEVALTARPIGR